MLDPVLAILVLLSEMHATLHALLYDIYSAARDGWDEVTRWARPFYWMIDDQFWVLIAMGQLVL